jgi:hypothetical protein
MEANQISVSSLKCPVCDAPPDKPCTRIDGHPMPGPHSKRKELIFAIGVRPEDREMPETEAVKQA